MRDADEIVLTDIYAASEEPIPGITLDALADAVHAGSGRPVHVVRRLEDVVPEVVKVARPGDVVITLGAGSIGTLPGRLLEALRARGADFAEPGSGDRGPGIGDRTPGQSAEGRDS
jgi:UDP-N-acetylmuramate--alanine ligase